MFFPKITQLKQHNAINTSKKKEVRATWFFVLPTSVNKSIIDRDDRSNIPLVDAANDKLRDLKNSCEAVLCRPHFQFHKFFLSFQNGIRAKVR